MKQLSPEEIKHMHKGQAVDLAFPCLSISDCVTHTKRRKLSVWWVERMRKMTAARGVCAWISCPAYTRCNLQGWGFQPSDRDEAGTIYEEILDAQNDWDALYSAKEIDFLEDLLNRLESIEDYQPTDKQINWLRVLHSRYISRKREGRVR